MNRALFAAASGMAAQQQSLETIAANLANSSVAGFKSTVRTFGAIAGPDGSSIGTAAIGAHTVFAQGKLMRSDGPFDLAIDGPGFFVTLDDRGRRAYTRDGSFSRAPDGTLRNAQGLRLEGVRISDGAVSASVAADGAVTARFAHGTHSCGRVKIAEFASPERLDCAGGTIFRATRASGPPRMADPGAPDAPAVRFGMLEQSNVSIVAAMMEIMAAQRAYEANAKGVQAADEMMRIADNLTRD